MSVFEDLSKRYRTPAKNSPNEFAALDLREDLFAKPHRKKWFRNLVVCSGVRMIICWNPSLAKAAEPACLRQPLADGPRRELCEQASFKNHLEALMETNAQAS